LIQHIHHSSQQSDRQADLLEKSVIAVTSIPRTNSEKMALPMLATQRISSLFPRPVTP
jgi:hypothetical protein